MLSPFAEAIASRREIACSAVSDFAATKIQSGVVCAAWQSQGVFHAAKDILWQVYAPTRLKSC